MLFKPGDIAIVMGDTQDTDHGIKTGIEVILLQYRKEYSSWAKYPAWKVSLFNRHDPAQETGGPLWVGEADLMGVAVDPKEVHEAIQSIKGTGRG